MMQLTFGAVTGGPYNITETCLFLGTFHTLFRTSRNTSTTATYSSNHVVEYVSYSAAFRQKDSSISLTATSSLTTFSWTGRRLQLSLTGRHLHGDVSLAAFTQVRLGRSGLYLGSFIFSIGIIRSLDNVWSILVSHYNLQYLVREPIFPPKCRRFWSSVIRRCKICKERVKI